MSQHEQFEVMCAQAVTGQMDDAELDELNHHLEDCADCKDRISDFAQISAQALPLYGENYGQRRSPKQLTARFVLRARAEGIPLSDPKPSWGSGLPLWPLRWQTS